MSSDQQHQSGGNDILTAAILQAEENGDTKSADKLRALADKPDELAALLKQLQPAKPGAGARTSD